jgi:hypothetical protein
MTQSMSISLWCKKGGRYPDEILKEDDITMTIRYCGQKNGRNDKYVKDATHFFHKENKKAHYNYRGRITNVTPLESEMQLHDGKNRLVAIFELTVTKEPVQSFRIKEDAYQHFGWKMVGLEFRSGIIKHTPA